MTQQLTATAVGVDIGTGGVELGVRAADGREASASVDTSDETLFRDDPALKAFRVAPLHERILNGLQQLADNGWTFQGVDQCCMSASVRQHDMVLTDADGQLLMDGDVLGWRCNAASEQVQRLRQMNVEAVVGRVEERFILPKLLFVLDLLPDLKDRIAHVMTTGDYVAWKLTGVLRLSTSDALSNGLLVQETKELAVDVLSQAGLPVEWFPATIQSGEIVGTVQSPAADPQWQPICDRLQGWTVTAGLGDNHATAVGCGLSDESTIIVSAGNSGTINRMCAPSRPLQGNAACFEYYESRMLLMMLADCAVWYDRFVESAGDGRSYAELNDAALAADLTELPRVAQRAVDAGWEEVLPEEWSSLSVGQRVAATQASIALELLLHVKAMLQEVESTTPIEHFVLTGGLSQSTFFQEAFAVGVQSLIENANVMVSDRTGPLAFQTAAYGALINAVFRSQYSSFDEAVQALCPCRPSASPHADRAGGLAAFFKRHLV